MAANGEHHLIGGQARSVRQMRNERLAMFLDTVHRRAANDVDAVIFHLGAQMRAHVIIESAQNVFAAIDQRHIRT